MSTSRGHPADIVDGGGKIFFSKLKLAGARTKNRNPCRCPRRRRRRRTVGDDVAEKGIGVRLGRFGGGEGGGLVGYFPDKRQRINTHFSLRTPFSQ